MGADREIESMGSMIAVHRGDPASCPSMLAEVYIVIVAVKASINKTWRAWNISFDSERHRFYQLYWEKIDQHHDRTHHR